MHGRLDLVGDGHVTSDGPGRFTQLVGRYLRPLEKLGAKSTAVLETVAAFIEHGLSVKATAEALDVHQNTV
ncbi:MAG TPA: helix-turn-helix domain-containing protein, partial [Acidimicrobiia bacterium]|nr:helix-turn-helix domain-containing protein [Acidimicrobiia bacterium]